MRSPLDDIGVALPVLAAPMAGDPSTPALVGAAARAGSLGFLAAGYKTAEALAANIAAVRLQTSVFGVNLFAPNPLPVDIADFQRYGHAIQAEADRYGIELPVAKPVEDDDQWRAKVDLLVADPVPVVSLTFGIPEPAVVTALRAAGSLVVQTVTSVDEAAAAAASGADVLAVQAAAAGGHSGTLTPRVRPRSIALPELVAAVRNAVSLPIIAAGGLAAAGDVAAAVRAGASAVMVGTALLRTDEAGTTPAHRAALADPAGRGTVVTRAFTGRFARGLRNEFIDRYDGLAPPGYPAIHHLTSPLRKAAAAVGDSERMHLWAGTGYRHATDGPAGSVLTRLAERL
ncbi:MAG TPA: nitronate monooxygenase [Micromonosporaceae bacterium]|nr:nitronate monooxygenase [Micromonosporaceae bacterium]